MMRGAALGAALLGLAVNVGSVNADIVIGVQTPLSGQYLSFGQQLLTGVKAAVDAANANGGISGEQLNLVSADDACDNVEATNAAKTLIAAHADVVIGSFCSNPSLTAAPLYEKAGITLISPSTMLPGFTESGLSNVIRLAPRLDMQGAFAAQRILAKRPNARMAILDDGTSQMKAITQSFAAAYPKGAEMVASFAPDQKDFSDIIAKLKAAQIDTIYVAASAPDAGRLAAQTQAAGLSLKRYGPESLLTDQYWEAAGNAGESTLVSFPSDPQSYGYARDAAGLLSAGGSTADGPTLPAYAAVQAYEAAAAASGAHSGKAIATWLRSGQHIDTVVGPVSFNAKGDTMDLRFSWFSWNNGNYQMIAPETQ